MDEEILKWVTDYCNGNICEEDFSALQAWLAEDPANQSLFDQHLALCHQVRSLSFLEQHNVGQAWRRLERRLPKRYAVRSLAIRWSIAASLVLLLGSAVFYFTNQKEDTVTYAYSDRVLPGSAKAVLLMADGEKVNLGPGYVQNLEEKDGTRLQTTKENVLVYNSVPQQKTQLFHTIEVPVGGEYSLQLSDGSRVWLNSATKMRYPISFTGDKREVFIEGEAFFEVSKDAEHPFVVHAGEAEVKVLGTEFNLSAYPEDSALVTTLKTGKVELRTEKASVELMPGRQAVLQRHDGVITTREVDASLYAAWIHGVFEFEDLSLERIGVQLSRWYGVQFVFTDPALTERYFTGGVKKYNTLRESLDLIEYTTNVSFEIVGTKVFVTSR